MTEQKEVKAKAKPKKAKKPKPTPVQNYEEFKKIDDKSQQVWILHCLGIIPDNIAAILRIAKEDVLSHINDYMGVGIPPYDPKVHTVKRWKQSFNSIMRVGYRKGRK